MAVDKNSINIVGLRTEANYYKINFNVNLNPFSISIQIYNESTQNTLLLYNGVNSLLLIITTILFKTTDIVTANHNIIFMKGFVECSF